MSKTFNTSADCHPQLHYMVDLTERLEQAKEMVDAGAYFTMNRARQYGKTTMLQALGEFLKAEYVVVSLDFQMMSAAKFQNEHAFSVAFARNFIKAVEMENTVDSHLLEELKYAVKEESGSLELPELFEYLSGFCAVSPRRVVLFIDEVDSASNYQVFLDFLAQLRGYYISRRKVPAFWSVILAGVYDIKNMRSKLRPGQEHKVNSPWNIAADFLIDMSFSEKEIAGMLQEYEADVHTGMNICQMAGLLYAYTSGYPYLVSRLCKLIDEQVAKDAEFSEKSSAWTEQGFLKAVRILLAEPNTLFDSLIHKLEDYPELERMLRDLLFQGKEPAYVIGVRSVETALMFGFVEKSGGMIRIANRIFEMLLYHLFLAAPKMQEEVLYRVALKDRNVFVENGCLNMTLVLERFVMHFDDLYGDQGQRFYEEDGRRYFMLFLKPIINGQGNCYVEAQTRNQERTDLIVDYHGERFVVEMKIWYGKARHVQGERQLAEYLEHYHLRKGYLIMFNFNKSKEKGVKEVVFEDKILVEAVV
ncbi:MAG: AAA-like domain-containing protein [Eubacterium sp.]|nr:AAA-like domain-containing protein [Eubacterium sp.]